MNHAAMGSHWEPESPVAFVAMWMAMMVPMMLPSLAPALREYHRMLDRPGASRRPGRSTATVAATYYAVWAAVGVALLPLGATRAGPLVVGVAVVLAGAIQLTAWKAHHLACCRRVAMRGAGAWRDGVRLGLHCCLSCAGPMAVLVAVGAMDVRAMAAVTAAITVERLAPDGLRAARVIGVLAIGGGIVLVARAVL